MFKNRFTGESYHISDSMLRGFCELTAANEIEIALDNPEFISKNGEYLYHLFTSMAPHLSVFAQEKVAEIFGSSCT